MNDLEVCYDVTLGTMPDQVGTVGIMRADVGPEPGETTVYAFDEVLTSTQARGVAGMLLRAADLADAG